MVLNHCCTLGPLCSEAKPFHRHWAIGCCTRGPWAALSNPPIPWLQVSVYYSWLRVGHGKLGDVWHLSSPVQNAYCVELVNWPFLHGFFHPLLS